MLHFIRKLVITLLSSIFLFTFQRVVIMMFQSIWSHYVSYSKLSLYYFNRLFNHIPDHIYIYIQYTKLVKTDTHTHTTQNACFLYLHLLIYPHILTCNVLNIHTYVLIEIHFNVYNFFFVSFKISTF